MLKKELKRELDKLNLTIQEFLLANGYNIKHLGRYKEDEKIPDIIMYQFYIYSKDIEINKLIVSGISSAI